MVSTGSVVATPGLEQGTRFGCRLARHPFRAFLLMLALAAPCYFLVGFVLYGLLGLPRQLSDMRAFSTVLLYTAGGILGYLMVPFLLEARSNLDTHICPLF